MLARFWWIPVLIIGGLAFLFDWTWWLASLLGVLVVGGLQLADGAMKRKSRRSKEADSSLGRG